MQDNDREFVALSENLKQISEDIIVRRFETQAEIQDMDVEFADMMFVDMSLPDSSREKTNSSIKKIADRYPVVIIGENSDLNYLETTYSNGVSDFLTKSELTPFRLKRVIIGALFRKEAEIEKRDLQRKFFHAQKMDQIVKMTSGIVHDFNNKLMIIKASTEVLARYKDKKDQFEKYLNKLNSAIDSAVELCMTLLAAGKEGHGSKILSDLGPLIERSVALSKHLLPSTVEIEVNINESIPAIEINQIQLDQIVMNLIINAGKAISGVGKIKVDLSILAILEPRKFDFGIVPVGEYVVLKVSDNGSGMTLDELRRVFDPYYTSRQESGGHGLGLTVVHAIAKENNAVVCVNSKPKIGSTFYIFFRWIS